MKFLIIDSKILPQKGFNAVVEHDINESRVNGRANIILCFEETRKAFAFPIPIVIGTTRRAIPKKSTLLR